MIIHNFGDFIISLLGAGFSIGGINDEEIFSICNQFDTNIVWHTGDPETDPWEWRMRVLNERDDIAYAKVFFRKSGFITKEWYPFFLAARKRVSACRGNISFEDEYLNGTVSNYSKRIYDVISENGSLSFHAIKKLADFGRDDKHKFEQAIIELQMKMYITMCGRQQKVSQVGKDYGWSSTVFCTTESFFGADVFEKALRISEQEAAREITAQIYKLNPAADEKRIRKFITV